MNLHVQKDKICLSLKANGSKSVYMKTSDKCNYCLLVYSSPNKKTFGKNYTCEQLGNIKCHLQP